MPKDFEEFWQNAVKEARKVDLNPTKRLLPERCTKDVNVYEVSFQNMQPNYRTYGILCVPVKEGRYPALLRGLVLVCVLMVVISIRHLRGQSPWRLVFMACLSPWSKKFMTICSTVP